MNSWGQAGRGRGQGLLRAWTAALCLGASLSGCAGEAEDPAVGRVEAALRAPTRDIAVVLEAGKWAAEDCTPTEYVGLIPSAWSCRHDANNPASWEGWRRQKTALQVALVFALSPDASTGATDLVEPIALRVFVSHAGQLRADGTLEHLDGPSLAIDRTVLRTEDDLQRFLQEIEALAHPRVRWIPPARDPCLFGYPAPDCPGSPAPGWALQDASAALDATPEAARREICMVVGPHERPQLPNSGFWTSRVDWTPTYPDGAFDPSAALELAEGLGHPPDRISVLTFGAPERGSAHGAALELLGEATGFGMLRVSLVAHTDPIGELVETSVDVAVRPGEADHEVARRIAGMFPALRSPQHAPVADGRRVAFASDGYLGRDVTLRVTGNVMGLEARVLEGSSGLAHSIRSFANRSTTKVRWADTSQGLSALLSSCFTPDARLRAIEVVQAVQDWHNSVTLVAGKQTTVRVFLDDPTMPPLAENRPRTSRSMRHGLSVRVRSCATTDPTTCEGPGYLLERRVGGVIETVVSHHDAETRLRRAWTFELPAKFAMPGVVEVVVRDAADRLECAEERANGRHGSNDCRTYVSFVDDSDLPILEVVPLILRAPDVENLLFSSWVPGSEVDDINAVLSEALPMADRPGAHANGYRLTLDGLPTTGGTHAPGERFLTAAHHRLRSIRSRFCHPTHCPMALIMAVVSPRMIYGETLGVGGVGVTVSKPENGLDIYLHEALHAFGRPHTPFCMRPEDADSCAEPYPSAYILPSSSTVSGELSFLNPRWRPAIGRATGPLEGRHYGLSRWEGALAPTETWDVMSYCAGPVWMSTFQWERLHHTVVGMHGGETGGDLSHFRRFPWAPRDVCGDVSSDLLASIEASAVLEDGVYLSGVLDDDEGVVFDAAFGGEGVALPTSLPTEHVVVAVGADGAELGRWAADTAHAHAQGGPHGDESFVAFVPRVDGVARYELREREGDATLGAQALSANAPTLHIDAPVVGARWEGTAGAIAWTANDADGDALRYFVEYSADGGASWTAVAETDETSVEAELESLVGGDDVFVRVWASDGARSTSAQVGPLSVVRRAPGVIVRSPRDGQRFYPDQTIAFDAYAFDQDQVELDPAGFVWSLDGEVLADTSRRDASELAAGEHVARLVVTDAQGVSKVRETRFTVLGPPAQRFTVEVTGPREVRPGDSGAAEVVVRLLSGPSTGEPSELLIREDVPLSLGPIEGCERVQAGFGCRSPDALSAGDEWRFSVPFVATEHGVGTITPSLDVPDARPVLGQLVVDVTGLSWELDSDLAPANARVWNAHTIPEPSGFRVFLPTPRRAIRVEPTAPEWHCTMYWHSSTTLCTWQGAEVAPGAELPEIHFVAAEDSGTRTSSRVVIESALEEPGPGERVTGTVVARNEGEVPHTRDVWLNHTFERSTVAAAAGSGWHCTTGVKDVSCRYDAGIEPGEETPPLSITLEGQAPYDIVTEIIEHPEEKWPGTEVSYLVEVRNEGAGPALDTVTARGTWPEGETILSATGEHWACEQGGRDFSCRYHGGVVLGGAVLPHLTLRVHIASVDGPGFDAGVGGLDAGVGFDGGLDGGSFDAGEGFDAGLDGALDGGHVLEAGALDASRDVDAQPGDDDGGNAPVPGVDLVIDGWDACNRVVDPETGERTGVFHAINGSIVVIDPLLDMPLCYEFHHVPANQYRFDGVVYDAPAATVPGHLFVAYDAPRQGGPWRYHVRIRNQGDTGTADPLRVRVTLPPGMTFRPHEGRSAESSVSAGWTCSPDGAELACTRDRGLAAGAHNTLFFGLDTAPDAWRAQSIAVRVEADDDVDASNDRFVDRLTNVVQPFGPSPAERHEQERSRLPSRLAVSIEPSLAPSGGELTVDEPASVRAVVTSLASDALPAGAVNARVLGAPSLAHVLDAGGEGWRCTPRWGEALCVFEGEVAPGAQLPAIEVSFLPGPQVGPMALPVAAFEPERLEVHGEHEVVVAPGMRASVGTLALSGCSPYADCWPTNSSGVGVERFPRVQLIGTDGTLGDAIDVYPRTTQHPSRAELQRMAMAHPRFSPEGDRLALVAEGATGNAGIYVLERGRGGWELEEALGGLSERQATFGGDLFAHTLGRTIRIRDRARNQTTTAFEVTGVNAHVDPAARWQTVALSPDGGHIAMTRGVPTQIWIAEIHRTETGRVEVGVPAIFAPGIGSELRDPAFSPTGEQLAFSVDGRIAVANLDGGALRFVTDGGGPDEADIRPSLSPDGVWIAFERGAPLPPLDLASTDARVAQQRALAQGWIRPYRDASVFVVDAHASIAPQLVARGRTPAWRPGGEPTAVAGLDAPLPREGTPAITIDTPSRIDGAPSLVRVAGRVSAAAEIVDAARVLFVFNREGRGTHGRRGVDARSLDDDRTRFLANPSAGLVRQHAADRTPGWVDACGRGTTLGCGMERLLDGLGSMPGAEVSVRSVLNRRDAIFPFFEDLQAATGAQGRTSPLADTDGDGVPDLVEIVDPNGSWPRHPFAATREVLTRRFIGDVRDGYDALLADAAEVFEGWPGEGPAVAYLVSAGRDLVDATIEGPLAALRAHGVQVSALVPPPPPVPPTLVVLTAQGLEAHTSRVAAFVDALDASLAGLEIERLTLGETELGLPGARHLSATGSLRDQLWGARAWLTAERAPGSFVHLVIITPGEHQEAVTDLAIEEAFPDGVKVHTLAPPGPASRPTATCGAPLAALNVPLAQTAIRMGGTNDSLCEGDFRVPTAIADELRADFVSECDHPSSALATIARLGGGHCRVLNAATNAPLPWSSRDGEDTATVELTIDGAPHAGEVGDGWWALDVPLAPGLHEVVALAHAASGQRAETRVTLDVNGPPVAMADELVARDGLGTLNVLANDHDPNGDPLRVVSAGGAMYGTVSCTPAGACTYRSVGSQPRADSFEYVVEDGRGGTATGVVTVEQIVNRRPVAANATFPVAPGGATSFDLAPFASDPDGDPIRFEIGQPSTGYLVCEGTRCEYAGAPASGEATIFYRVYDPAGAMGLGEVRLVVDEAAPRLALTVETEGLDAGSTGQAVVRVWNEGAGDLPFARLVVRALSGATVVAAAGDGWHCEPAGTMQRCQHGPLSAGQLAEPLSLALEVDAHAHEVLLLHELQRDERTTALPVRREANDADDPDAIPDDGRTFERSVVVAGGASSRRVLVDLAIEHPDRGELVIAMRAPNGGLLTLSRRQGAGISGFSWRGRVDLGAPPVDGTWTLLVTDEVPSSPSVAGRLVRFDVQPETPPAADLSVSLDVPSTLQEGDEILASVDVRNHGPSSADAVELELSWPSALAIGHVADGWSCVSADAGARCSPTAPIPAGTTRVWRAFFVGGSSGEGHFEARVRSPGDPSPTNDVATTSVQVVASQPTPVHPEPVEPIVEPEPIDPADPEPEGVACEPDAPVCTLGRQTLVGACELASAVGIAHAGPCVFGLAIPDGSSTGITATIDVAGGATSTQLTLDLDVRHADRGDLVVRLTAPNGASLLLTNRAGAGQRDFRWRGTITVPWVGVDGPWTISVVDANANGLTGTLEHVNLLPAP